MNLINSFNSFKSLKEHTLNIQDEKTEINDTQEGNPLADKLEDLKNKVEAFKREYGIKNYEDSMHNNPFDKVY